MKRKITILGSLVLLVTMSFAFALTSPDEKYFEGKWSVLIKGTPNGDATIPMRFETVDGKTTGYFTEEGAAEEKKMSTATIKDDVINTSFNISGYDVTLSLKKVDADNAKGDLMGMFDAEGKRVK
ncbi:hypothetical protein [Algoriphagus aquimarinus]|uniref:Uncharacterized protein n=1 Tax=Algoriphagus aquimarinus TaxID=237018 RepID=A0A1I0Y7B6_9BACT|nr:hypothetical protein [Algoriphagus aquimarinus]SFB08420.1 hypothetical protein SAMN04489723_104118 [Algoriphagus aquimarinus]|tara:strand:- start:65811 stop:66185 length:375 start_codon:yes stop_codon:yes gene_type:complete